MLAKLQLDKVTDKRNGGHRYKGADNLNDRHYDKVTDKITDGHYRICNYEK